MLLTYKENTACIEYNEKKGLFTGYPGSQQKQLTYTKSSKKSKLGCDPMEVEPIIRQGAAGPAAEAKWSLTVEGNQTSTGQGYVDPKHINDEISFYFSGPSSAESLWNKQLKTSLPVIKLPANSEAVMVSAQTSQEHSRHDVQAKELPNLLPRWAVRLQNPQTKKWPTRREVPSRVESSLSYVV